MQLCEVIRGDCTLIVVPAPLIAVYKSIESDHNQNTGIVNVKKKNIYTLLLFHIEAMNLLILVIH